MKRFDPFWRIVIALLLIFALAPVVALSGAVIADPDPAETTITPISDYVKVQLTEITGTAIGNATNNVTMVKVQIWRTSDGSYWTGAIWQVVPTWLNATASDGSFNESSEAWKITTTTTPDLPTWTDGYTYYIRAMAEAELDDDDTPAIESFTYDITEPGTTIDVIPDYVNELSEITGTATDTSPGKINGVEVRIQRDSDDKYWSGTTWHLSSILQKSSCSCMSSLYFSGSLSLYRITSLMDMCPLTRSASVLAPAVGSTRSLTR